MPLRDYIITTAPASDQPDGASTFRHRPLSSRVLLLRFVCTALLLTLAGCATISTEKLADNLSRAMLNQDDPVTVRAGAPAYLLLLDSMIEDKPSDRNLLTAGARLYGAFATGLVDDATRAKRLSNKSLAYARKALCTSGHRLCDAEKLPFEQFSRQVAQTSQADLGLLYTYGTSWAGWIQARPGDWNALAELPRVEQILDRVIELDPSYERGRAQLYLAVMRSQLPASLGGKPEAGRIHFERALEFSGGRDLMAKVEFARRYARLVFDQKLHDRLLHEVLNSDPVEPDLTLSNILAQQQAAILLKDDYF